MAIVFQLFGFMHFELNEKNVIRKITENITIWNIWTPCNFGAKGSNAGVWELDVVNNQLFGIPNVQSYGLTAEHS